MASSGMLRRVALVRTDVSEELNVPFIRVTRIGELETTLAVTSNQRTLALIWCEATITDVQSAATQNIVLFKNYIFQIRETVFMYFLFILP
jgi:hypothetical protein